MSAKESPKNQRAKTKIQQQIDAAHEVHRKELLRKRIETARSGLKSYEAHRLGEAVKSFKLYLRILEDWKQVPEGGLHPGLFDKEKDKDELLLISGVYWDLVKLYDRTKSDNKFRELVHYLDKYVTFAKGSKHQPLAAETMRKYITNNGARHAEQFKSAYKVIGDSTCFIATAVLEETSVNTHLNLRKFRDFVLIKSKVGRMCITCYYLVGSRVAPYFETLPKPLKQKVGKGIDHLAKIIELRWKLSSKAYLIEKVEK